MHRRQGRFSAGGIGLALGWHGVTPGPSKRSSESDFDSDESTNADGWPICCGKSSETGYTGTDRLVSPARAPALSQSQTILLKTTCWSCPHRRKYSHLQWLSRETPWFSQILVSGSPDTRVQRNRGRGGTGLRPRDLYCRGRAGELRVAAQCVAINDITFYGPMGVSGFHSSHGRIEDVVENNRFEGNSIHVVQGFTLLRFRIGREYLDLERAQQRGQEIHSRIEFAPSGTTANLDMKCPPGVGRGGAL